MSAAFVLISTGAFADASGAKAALAQNTTNSFCSAGYNGASPYDKEEMYKKEGYKNGCPAGTSYVECLRQSWKKTP